MDWTAPIDIYCERLSADFWAEPINAITNASFIIAAFIGYWVAKRQGKLDAVNGILIGLSATIGVGSFLFHTYATGWAKVADQIPIMVLAVVYIAFSVRRFLHKSWGGVALIAFIYFAISAGILYLLAPLSDGILAPLNGSHVYAPLILGLGVLALAMRKNGSKGTPLVTAAVITFGIAVIFRSIDSSICETVPLGTHFLWHSLNGLLVGFLLVAIIKYGQSPTAKS